MGAILSWRLQVSPVPIGALILHRHRQAQRLATVVDVQTPDSGLIFRAIEAVDRAFSSGQCHVTHGTADAAIAVVKRVQGHQPQMRQPSVHQRITRRIGVEPFQKRGCLCGQGVGGRCLKMHFFATHGARDTIAMTRNRQ